MRKATPAIKPTAIRWRQGNERSLFSGVEIGFFLRLETGEVFFGLAMESYALLIRLNLPVKYTTPINPISINVIQRRVRTERTTATEPGMIDERRKTRTPSRTPNPLGAKRARSPRVVEMARAPVKNSM